VPAYGHHSEFLDRRIVFARQRVERECAVIVDAEIDLMVRNFVFEEEAPQVGVVAAQREFVLVLEKKRLQLRGQELDHAPCQIAMRHRAPGERRHRHDQDGDHDGREDGAFSHAAILASEYPRASHEPDIQRPPAWTT
jgi:hypothetical protein